MNNALPFSALSIAALVLLQPAADAQSPCAQWSEEFGLQGVGAVLNAGVRDQVVFDDGTGPALYVCGGIDAGGDAASSAIVKWDGQRWSSFGGGVGTSPGQGSIRALCVYDDGNGPALYAGGFFFTIGGASATNVAKWNGATWEPVGNAYGHAVNDMIVFDDGAGPKLYIAGTGYASSGGASFSSIVGCWDGSTWTTPGGVEPSPDAMALAVHDDGTGPALYVGGEITSVGSLSAHNLVRWDGTSWTSVGGGLNGFVYSLAEHDDGTGAALIVGGSFTSAGGTSGFNRVARWKNAAWSALGIGANSGVRALASYDDGSGPALFAGGDFATAGGVTCNRVARWNGSTWSAMGTPPGFATSPAGPTTNVRSLLVHDDGSGAGPSLYVGGVCGMAGAIRADNIARWNASGWSALGAENGADDLVLVLGSFDPGTGRELYAAGEFEHLGAAAIHGFAKWNGSSWSPTNPPAFTNAGTISALHEYDDGSGNALYIGGSFAAIGGVAVDAVARWNGTQFSDVGGGVNGTASAFADYDDGTGNALWVGGSFLNAGAGSVTASNIARWNGTNWFAPSTGPNTGGGVLALAAYDDGSGPALYVGGGFQKVGSTYVFGIARWNGTSWSPVGSGFNSVVTALAVFDDGSGAKLYAGGSFTQAPPSTPRYIARWNGVSWQPVGLGFDSSVAALESFDDGSGSALYAAGFFTVSNGISVRRIARWNGSSWSAVAGGLNGYAKALHAFDGGAGSVPRLFVGGNFLTAGSAGSSRIAALELRCPCPPQTYCTAGTSSNGCVPSIGSSGTPSASGASSFVVTASNVEGQKLGLLFYGLSGATSSPWGASTSVLCVKPPQQRTGQTSSGGTPGACDGALVLDWNAYLAAHPSALGQPFQAGTLVRMQGWYRDPPNPKTTSLTDAVEFLLCP